MHLVLAERVNGLFSLQNPLNLNSLLVKRQVDNPSPGAVTGGNYLETVISGSG